MSVGRCQTDCASEAPPSLLPAAAALLSTSDANTSLPCDGADSDRAERGGALGTFAASDVTLTTGGLSKCY